MQRIRITSAFLVSLLFTDNFLQRIFANSDEYIASGLCAVGLVIDLMRLFIKANLYSLCFSFLFSFAIVLHCVSRFMGPMGPSNNYVTLLWRIFIFPPLRYILSRLTIPLRKLCHSCANPSPASSTHM